jgi:ATP-dependent Lon protease
VAEKILAADRVRARRIIVPEGDRCHWQDHPTTAVLTTKVVFVGSIAEALHATV